MPKTEIHISSDKQAAYKDTAQLFVDLAKAAVAERGVFTVALSGGSTPKPLFEMLASPEWANQIAWSKIEFFWGDERYVPPTDAASNFHMADVAMLSRVPVDRNKVHRLLTEKPAQEAATLYEQEIRRVIPVGNAGLPEFDLNFLGLGSNGHTASLFPHQAALRENDRLVVADYVEEVHMMRITMTVPLINASRTIMIFVLGHDKAGVVREVVQGERDPERLPAQLIQPTSGKLIWMLDAAAASDLRKR
ncbi:MAG TPA: 6-phosphogluconolactonase [Terriglobales bacterium]|nr:6-phosphogluconolactonase [Terriglobales bacterium]